MSQRRAGVHEDYGATLLAAYLHAMSNQLAVTSSPCSQAQRDEEVFRMSCCHSDARSWCDVSA
jgi:hypothetical protein